MPNWDERRTAVREPIELIVDYDGPEDLVSDYTENLSSGGTFIATRKELAIGTPIKLMLSFPGLLERASIEGTVRWRRPDGPDGPCGVGIEFLAGPARDRLGATMQRIRDRDPAMVSRLFKVFVVEDNHHVTGFIEQGLHGSARRDFRGGIAFEFQSVHDGHSALEVLQQHAGLGQGFDAMIVDVYLPGVSGSQVIAYARGKLGMVETPIIAVSGGGDEAKRLALGAGATVFLDKPMRLRQLVQTMQSLLAF